MKYEVSRVNIYGLEGGLRSDRYIIACVASVSNRVIARTLERKQKKVEGGGGGDSFIFFCSCLVPAF